MFAPLSGVSEDPATGSANAAIGGYLASMAKEQNGIMVFEIVQGVEMGRPSQLRVTAEKKNGFIVGVRVGGNCIPITRGTLTI